MTKINLILIGIFFSTIISYANMENEIIYNNAPTGVEIIFSEQGLEWSKIRVNTESELTIGDRKDIRESTSKAMLRGKALISKFFKEEVKSSETLDAMTKTISETNNKDTSVNRKTIESLTEKISNSSEMILKGIIILEQKINKKDKYVTVTMGMSRKTITVADTLSKTLEKDSTFLIASQEKEENFKEKPEVRRGRNYENF